MIYNYPYHRNYYNRHSNSPTNNFKPVYRVNEDNNKDLDKNIVNEDRNSEDEFVIEILGIKLYFDDLLIIGLLYLLYDQEVKDINLYIVLILLLLS